jgi:signal transduction histidine kinase
MHAIMVAVITGLVGLFPYLQRPNAQTRLFALSNMALVAWNLTDICFLAHNHQTMVMLYRIGLIVGVFAAWFFYRFLLSFGDSHGSLFRRIWLLILAIGIFLIVISPTTLLIKDIDSIATPFREIPGPLMPLYASFFMITLCFAFVYFVLQLRQAKGALRNQLLYLCVALAFTLLEALLYFRSLYVESSSYSYYYLQVVYTVIVSYAIVSHRLMDITIVIRRTLIYSLMSAALTAMSLFVMALLLQIQQQLTGRSIVLTAALSATLMTLFFHPLMHRAQALIDRLFFRERLDREKRLLAFSQTMSSNPTMEALSDNLARLIEDAFHPKSWALFLRSLDHPEFTAEEQSGDFPSALASDNPWTERWKSVHTALLAQDSRDSLPDARVRVALPLWAGDELLGFLLLGAKRSELPYTEEDISLLSVLVSQAAAAYEKPKLLQEVSGSFVHEIKMPLTNIVLPAELGMIDLREAAAVGAATSELVNKLQKRLQFIIDYALLAARRLDAMQQLNESAQGPSSPCDIRQVIDKSLAGLHAALNRNQIEVRVEVPEGLPEAACDPRQAEIVVSNLIKNAMEAMLTMPEGKRRLEVTAGLVEGQVEIQCRDTGPGIEPSQRDKIFRASVTTKGADHRGLGLFLVQRIVRSHGGTVRLEDHLGGGSTFIVRLPVVATSLS